MGLIDILNGMQNGPRGQSLPKINASTGSGGGMSPMMMALAGLLAYKAVKSRGGVPAAPGTASNPKPPPSGGALIANQQGGGIGDVLGGLLGGKLLGGAAAGTVLSSGLNTIVKELQKSGQGRAAQSWIGTGPNEKVESSDLASALGNDTLDVLSKQTGIGRDELLAGLSQHLPDLIDKLTPGGRLPTEEEASRIMA
jgi:uncharacterized protein YidB (DUF937 family)